MTILTWIATKALGPAVGTMVGGAVGSVKKIDDMFTAADQEDLNTARARNGECSHIQFVFSSRTFSERAPGEASDSARLKTTMYGKRFKCDDITRMYWHPSMDFIPDGPVSAICVGSKQSVPAQDKVATLRDARPAKRRVTCVYCGADTERELNELAKYQRATLAE